MLLKVMEELTERSKWQTNYLKEVIRESGYHLGYKEHEQTKAILLFVQGSDTFVALPTGYRKSLIYAALPYVFDVMQGSYLYFHLNVFEICFFRQLW